MKRLFVFKKRFPIRLKRSLWSVRRTVEKEDSFITSICFRRRRIKGMVSILRNSKLELVPNRILERIFCTNSSCKNSRLEIVGKRKGGKCWSEWLLFKYLKKLNRVEEGNKDANERSRASMLEEGILLKNISVPSRITKIVEQLETNDTVVYLLSTSARLVSQNILSSSKGLKYLFIQVKERERERDDRCICIDISSFLRV